MKYKIEYIETPNALFLYRAFHLFLYKKTEKVEGTNGEQQTYT